MIEKNESIANHNHLICTFHCVFRLRCVIISSQSFFCWFWKKSKFI